MATENYDTSGIKDQRLKKLIKAMGFEKGVQQWEREKEASATSCRLKIRGAE